MARHLRLIVIAAAAIMCTAGDDPKPREAGSIADAIIAACPVTAPDTAAERDRCSESLGRSSVLARLSGDTIRWGGAKDGEFAPEANELTRLNSFVWRKLYLSLFRFDGTYKIEQLDQNRTLLRLGVELRHLPPGDFPYPFWHSESKWRSYQQSSQIVLVLFGDRLVAGYRNGAIDTTKPVVDHAWDGQWRWPDNGSEQPRVSLFSYVLSKENPYRSSLDRSYRQLETAMRPFQCESCHNPANPSKIRTLVFLTHPAQTLTARHDIVHRIAMNTMPPEGIANDRERRNLQVLAERFAEQGDQALQFELDRSLPQERSPR